MDKNWKQRIEKNLAPFDWKARGTWGYTISKGFLFGATISVKPSKGEITLLNKGDANILVYLIKILECEGWKVLNVT